MQHGPPSLPHHEFLNVGGWLTHGDLALGDGVDFLAVAGHRLIPARVRSEWSRLRKKGFSSIWAEWHVVCQRVRRFIRSCYGEFWVWHFLVFLASLLCLVCLGSASFASLPFAHKTWVS